MNDIVSDYSQAVSGLKVHKRAADNVKEQLSTILGDADYSAHRLHVLLNAVSTKIPELQRLSNLSPLKAYLYQGETSHVLDSLFDACWTYALECHDEHVREDILEQRQIYESDRKADGVSLRRLLRDCLRTNVDKHILELDDSEVNALLGAIQTEVKAAEQTPDTARLYQQFLSRRNDIDNEYGGQMPRNSGDLSKTLQDLTEKVVRVNKEEFSWGAICSFYSAELYGKRVALATPKPWRTYKIRMDAIAAGQVKVRWKDFDHPNVLPLLGIVKNFQDGIALVSPWMSNGAIDYYLRDNPTVDRLKLIIDIASGLNYLHSLNPPYVHGIINLGCTLVDNEGNAVIGGFASAIFEEGLSTSLRYLAPEHVKKEETLPSMASDVYSFARVALYIVTDNKPFSEIHNSGDVIRAILYKQRPSRPPQRLLSQRGLEDSDKLWALLVHCWSDDPDLRPSMATVLRILEDIRQGQMGPSSLMDVRDLTRMLSFPEGVNVRASGSFGDVRTGQLDGFGKVALKTITVRGVGRGNLRTTKRFFREASIWNSLKHPNILPFLGTADPPGLATCLVSPWIENGNLVDYLRSIPPGTLSDYNALYIAYGIANGLDYLHKQNPPVIHGDLRGANILISPEGNPLLCDFGLAVIVEDLTHIPLSNTLQNTGNPRWMAPELFVGEGTLVSVNSDVWALGMVLLEITTLDIPYRDIRSSTQVILEVYKGITPSRPTSNSSSSSSTNGFSSNAIMTSDNATIPSVRHQYDQEFGQMQAQVQSGVSLRLTDELWAVMLRCWARESHARPSAGEVANELERIRLGMTV